MTTTYPSKASPTHEIIKLGIEAHAKHYWVSRQVDGATPQPVQKMTYDELLLFVSARRLILRPPHRIWPRRGWASASEGVCLSKGAVSKMATKLAELGRLKTNGRQYALP